MISGPSYAKTIGNFTITNAAWTLALIGFTATDIQTADRLILSVTTGAARVTWDHGYTSPQAPTTLIGQRISNNNYPLFVLQGRSNTANFKIVRDAGVDAVVTITLESD
jgi:hypothetical protein